MNRSSRPEVFCKRDVFRHFAKFTGKHLCQSLYMSEPQACNFIKKENLAQVFSCEFCKISKNTFFHKTPLVAASARNGLIESDSLIPQKPPVSESVQLY